MIAYLSEAFAAEAQGLTQKTEQKEQSLVCGGGYSKMTFQTMFCVTAFMQRCAAERSIRELKGFFKQQEPMRLTLYTLGKSSGDAFGGRRRQSLCHCENPAVFSEIVRRHPKTAAVCTDGQPRLAAFVLMDLLKAHTVFYYMGDYDPEGLLIAQRLKERYGDRLVFVEITALSGMTDMFLTL